MRKNFENLEQQEVKVNGETGEVVEFDANSEVNENYVKDYITLQNKIDELTKIQSEMKNKLKTYLSENNLNKLNSELGYVSLITTEKTTYDDEKVANYCKSNNYDVVKTIEVLDEEKLEELIYNGKISLSELDPYKETKTIQTLRINKKKK